MCAHPQRPGRVTLSALEVLHVQKWRRVCSTVIEGHDRWNDREGIRVQQEADLEVRLQPLKRPLYQRGNLDPDHGAGGKSVRGKKVKK